MSDTTPKPDPTSSFRAASPTSCFFDALASERRRAVLAVLLDEGGTVSEGRLADRVAAYERDVPVTETADSDPRDVRVTCHHLHLPKLQEASLLERDTDEAVVTTDDEARAILTEIAPLIRGENGVAPGRITATMSVLANRRRRTILTLLKRRSTMTIEDASEAIASRELDRPIDDDVTKVMVDLEHRQVPKLVELGVVETGESGQELIYCGNELLDDDLLEMVPHGP